MVMIHMMNSLKIFPMVVLTLNITEMGIHHKIHTVTQCQTPKNHIRLLELRINAGFAGLWIYDELLSLQQHQGRWLVHTLKVRVFHGNKPESHKEMLFARLQDVPVEKKHGLAQISIASGKGSKDRYILFPADFRLALQTYMEAVENDYQKVVRNLEI